MTRRFVIGARGGQFGAFVAKAGFDALTTSEENLLFSMTRRELMLVQKGSVTLATEAPYGSGFVPWASGVLTSTPLVFCYDPGARKGLWPIGVEATPEGFQAYALQGRTNIPTYAAAGRTVPYQAFMRAIS